MRANMPDWRGMEKATSVRRAVELLIALADDEALSSDGRGVNRLAEVRSDDKSRVSRTLQTLQEYGLVQRDPDTLAYRLGWRLYTLAARAGDARLLAAAPPIIADLVADLGETAHLSVLVADRVLTIISQVSPHAVIGTGWVGREVPAHCTSSGRALLLDHELSELERRFGGQQLPAAGERAPRTIEGLHERIVEAREAGYAAVVEEHEIGTAAIAVPVRDHRNRIIAALNVSGPAFRFEQRLLEAGERLCAAAVDLAAAVGWQPLGDVEAAGHR
jgi:DNA-binding IclR family transcriptional regulator